MTVRPATTDDAAAIALVHIRTWQRAYADLLPAGYLDGLDGTSRAEMWRQIIDGRIAPTETYVADVDGEIVGFASVGRYRPDEGAEIEPDVGEVYAIYVDPSQWSTGVGRALLDVAVEHLTDAGFAEIRLWVFEHNPRARRFYERAGFKWDGDATTDLIDAGGPYETEATEVRYTRSAL
jgi:ribosomal protein S18 acetylase RimI-like enzyme